MTNKRIVIVESEQDTIEWLSDEDGNVIEGAQAVYESMLIARMADYFDNEFAVEIQDGGRSEIRIYGVSQDEERGLQDVAQNAWMAIMDSIGNSMDEWVPA